MACRTPSVFRSASKTCPAVPAASTDDGGVLPDQFSPDELRDRLAALRADPTSQLRPSLQGDEWCRGGGLGAYDHTLPPGAPSLAVMPYYESAFPASSAHPAGVHALMLDGSVAAYTPSVDLGVWRAIGTRDGGETLAQ